jgi:putative cardiolipin synthase
MIFDNKITFVGSLNLDPRSVYLNTEIGVLFSNAELSEKIKLTLKQNLNDGAYQVLLKDGELQWYDSSNNTYLDSEPDASIWRRFGAWLTGLLPIEDQI